MGYYEWCSIIIGVGPSSFYILNFTILNSLNQVTFLQL